MKTSPRFEENCVIICEGSITNFDAIAEMRSNTEVIEADGVIEIELPTLFVTDLVCVRLYLNEIIHLSCCIIRKLNTQRCIVYRREYSKGMCSVFVYLNIVWTDAQY